MSPDRPTPLTEAAGVLHDAGWYGRADLTTAQLDGILLALFNAGCLAARTSTATADDHTAADVANEFNRERYGIEPPEFPATDDEESRNGTLVVVRFETVDDAQDFIDHSDGHSSIIHHGEVVAVCPTRQCRGRLPHSQWVHWFGSVLP